MRSFTRIDIFLPAVFCLLCLAPAAMAQAPTAADRVFSLSAGRDGDGRVALRWRVSPGNYLYRDSLAARLGGRDLTLEMPAGERKDDPNFGAVEVYRGSVEARLAAAPADGRLEVTYQGCAEQGICYPPIAKTIDLATLAVGASRPGLGGAEQGDPPTAPTDPPATGEAGASGVSALIAGGSLPMLGAFLGFGLLLSLTPCMFPMIPILAAMLGGAGARLSAGRGFVLSLSYVLAMAAAYGLVGLAAGWSGANLQAMLQTPWALGLAAAVFAALALAMCGLYELALPAPLAARLSGGIRRGGSIPGAAALGFGSALIVSPCVTPPLAAAMLYAAQTGEAGRGAAALFALGLGMGLPLIAVGTFGARILPKSGPWLLAARKIFGVVFLGIAAMLLARLLAPPAALALWGVLALGAGVFLGGFDRLGGSSRWQRRLGKAAGLAAALYGAMLIVGAAGGGEDPVRPLAFLAPPDRTAIAPATRVASLAAFEQAVGGPAMRGRPVLVSFTADWCTVCKSNERAMAEPALRRRLGEVAMIRADVTAQDEAARLLMARFAIVGPPTLFLLGADGREVPGSRLVGPVTAADMSRRLSLAGA